MFIGTTLEVDTIMVMGWPWSMLSGQRLTFHGIVNLLLNDATGITLVLVPCFYVIVEDLRSRLLPRALVETPDTA